MKMKLYRGQLPAIGLGEIDVTVKSAEDPWRRFAPTWKLVMDHKSRKIQDETYRDVYYALLNSRILPIEELKAAATGAGGFVTFCCYCRSASFCHTDLLIDYLAGARPDEFERGR